MFIRLVITCTYARNMPSIMIGGDNMAGIIRKELRDKVWELHYEGYSDGEIAKKLNITEFIVVKILGK